jgi:hypothetical protein
MIELAALALFIRIAGLGYEPVFATRVVCAGLDTLHVLLTDPRTYRGAAYVRPSSSAEIVVVLASFGPRRAVRYTWVLTPGRGTTEVDLAVQVDSRGAAVRLALLLGGRRWLRRRCEAMLAALARATADAAEQVVTRPAAPVALSDAA